MLTGVWAYGQESTQDSTTGTLDEVVITANRFPQKQQQTGKVLTVIPRAVIDRSLGRNLGEILNQYAGITIIGSNNNPGTNTDVYTRGSGLGNTLILLDGVPLYDVSSISSAFDLNFFTPEMVERIEILKGGQSTIYGSDAVAGVINIITRKPGKDRVRGNASLGAGSFGTVKAGAGLNGTLGNTGYRLQYQHLRTGGLSSAIDTSGSKDFDNDGLNQHNLLGGLNGRFSDKLSWKLNGQMNTYRAELDANAFLDDGDHTVENRNYVAGAGLEYRLSNTVIHANYTLNTTRREYLDDSASIGGFSKFSTSDYRGLGHFAELYSNITAGKHWSFLVGTDARWQRTEQDFLSISSFGPFETSLSGDSARISMYSAYASAFYNAGNGFFMEAGGRWNNHSRFGNNFTYTLNPSYVRGNWKLFLNISSAFKAPTLFQLYDALSGQPALKPERSFNSEAGLQYSAFGNAWQTRLVFFQRQLKDGIDYSFVDFRYFNNNSARDKGLELESFYRKGKWNIAFNYTWQTGEVNTVKYKYDPPSFSYIPDGDTSYNYQFRRPRHSINLTAGYQVSPAFFVSLHGRYAGKRFEPRFMDSPIELDPYVVLDLYAEYKIGKHLRLYLDLKNLADADFVDINGFTTRPRNVMIGGVVSF